MKPNEEIARDCAENIICTDTVGTTSTEDWNAFTALILAAIAEATAAKDAEIARLTAQCEQADGAIKSYEDTYEACESSVVEASVQFVNVGDYIKQLETERDRLRAENAKLRNMIPPSAEHQLLCECELERDQLRAELDTTKADTERLDWCQKNASCINRYYPMLGESYWEVDAATKATLRAAIDAARKEDKP